MKPSRLSVSKPVSAGLINIDYPSLLDRSAQSLRQFLYGAIEIVRIEASGCQAPE